MSTQDDILATISADQLLAISLHLMSVNPSDSQARAVASLYERSVAKRLERERTERKDLIRKVTNYTNYTPPEPPAYSEPPEDYIPTARRNSGSSPRFGIDPSPIASPETSTTPDEPA